MRDPQDTKATEPTLAAFLKAMRQQRDERRKTQAMERLADELRRTRKA